MANKVRMSFCVLSALTLAACSTPITKPASTTPIKASTPAPAAMAKAPKKTIAPETLYDLLVAEMGGKVNRLEIALGNYMRQAHLTKDPLVVARYARIASYMQAHQAMEDATSLWLEIDSDNIEALHFALLIEISKGSAPAQKKALTTLLEVNDTLNLLAIEQQLISTTAAQREMFQGVLTSLVNGKDDLYRNNPHLWYLRGKLNSIAGNHPAVIDDITQLHELDKKLLSSYALLVDAYEKTDQLDLAKKSLKELTELDPSNKKIRLYYTRLLIRVADFDEASQEFDQLIVMYPKDLDLHLTAGALATQLENYDKALAHFQTLLSAPYRTNEALLQSGITLELKGEQDSAIETFMKITPSPIFQEARFRAAELLMLQDKTDQAVEVLSQGAQMQPKAKHLYDVTIAEALERAGRPQDGINHLTQALDDNQEDLNLRYSKAILLANDGQYEDAEHNFRKILKQAPNNVATLNALGYTLADRNVRLEEAQVLLDKAIKLSPNDPPILDSLGWLAFRKGDLKTALDLLEQAYNLLPDHEIAAHFGEVLWVVGEKERAQQIWQEALENTPDSPIIESTIQRLNSN